MRYVRCRILVLKQKDIGERIGMTGTAIHNYEKGSPIPARMALLLGEIFGINPEWLLEGRGEPIREVRLIQSALERLQTEYNLSPGGLELVRAFVTLDAERQDAILNEVLALAGKISENRLADQIGGGNPDRPEKNLSEGVGASDLRAELGARKTG